MDYNLQGMNYIHLRHALFRQGELRDEYDDIEPFTELLKPKPPASSSILDSESLLDIHPHQRLFDPTSLPPSLLLPKEVVRQVLTISSCSPHPRLRQSWSTTLWPPTSSTTTT